MTPKRIPTPQQDFDWTSIARDLGEADDNQREQIGHTLTLLVNALMGDVRASGKGTITLRQLRAIGLRACVLSWIIEPQRWDGCETQDSLAGACGCHRTTVLSIMRSIRAKDFNAKDP